MLFLSILAQIFDDLEHVIIQVMLKCDDHRSLCFVCSVQQTVELKQFSVLMVFMLISMPQ